MFYTSFGSAARFPSTPGGCQVRGSEQAIAKHARAQCALPPAKATGRFHFLLAQHILYSKSPYSSLCRVRAVPDGHHTRACAGRSTLHPPHKGGQTCCCPFKTSQSLPPNPSSFPSTGSLSRELSLATTISNLSSRDMAEFSTAGDHRSHMALQSHQTPAEEQLSNPSAVWLHGGREVS